MNPSLDLAIKNYTLDDLQKFLGLSDNYTLNELNNNENTKSLSIMSSNTINTNNKLNILKFITTAKQILSYKFANETTASTASTVSTATTASTATNAEEPKTINNIGKIINPFSNHQSLQIMSIPSNNINGYSIKEKTTSYTFNTQFRDDYFKTRPSDCNFNLPGKIKNVASIRLAALQVPNVMLTFDVLRGTSSIFIKEDTTNNQAFVQINNGNYSIIDFPIVLEKAINNQVNPGILPTRFKVIINPFNHFTTVTNDTYTFTMNIINKPVDYLIRKLPVLGFNCSVTKYRSTIGYDNDLIDPDNDVSPSMLYNSMGYFMGYRQPIYSGKQSYTSESMFDNVYTDYIYFVLNDYNKNYRDVVTGILPNELIAENILSIVPITSDQFSTNFINGSDLIYKTRKYDSPVEISKISIKMLNQYGELLNLYLNDYAFCIEVTTLYNISGGNEFS